MRVLIKRLPINGDRSRDQSFSFTFKRNERRKDLAKEKIKQIPTNVSADRYNPNETYKRGNIVFCCRECNRKKNTAYKQDWVNFLKGRKKIIK